MTAEALFRILGAATGASFSRGSVDAMVVLRPCSWSPSPSRRHEEMNAEIIEFTAHPVDLAKEKVTQAAIPKDAELDSYIRGLLDWAYDEEDVRQFYFAEATTEVRAALQRVMAGQNLSFVAGIIASRLLKQEKAALEEVEHLKGIHEGMLLQALFCRHSVRGVLLAKVDLSEFLGRNDFRSHSGIDKKHRLLKFCLIEFSLSQEIQAVHVGDTNSTISTYWWKDFLELTEQRTDSSNTKVAFATFDSFLGKNVREQYPRDYPCLFNEVLRRFKRNQAFKFSAFLDDVFDGYRPVHANLDVKDLKQRARALLDKKKFDANFTILPDEVSKRFKKTYSLTPQIEVTVTGEIEDLADEISAFQLKDGTKGVFIKSESGFGQFPPRPAVQTDAVKSGQGAPKKQVAPSPQAKVLAN